MQQNEGQHIGVALSGGGHRASLFTLGAMMYLVDAKKGPELACVSSVSGGSITNGFLAKNVDLLEADPAEMRRVAAEFAQRIQRRGSVFGAVITWVWATVMVLILLPVALGPLCGLIILLRGQAHLSVTELVVWLVLLVLLGFVAQLRSRVAVHALNSTLFDGHALNETPRRVAHVLCATDIQTAEAAYFSPAFVYAFRWKWGMPLRLSLARAVQASAAFPGGFNVARVPLKYFGFDPEAEHPSVEGLTFLKLLDGGVYDNMGTEWLLGLKERIANVNPAGLRPIDEAVVINASAGADVTPRPRANVPILGEIIELLAIKDVMYDQSTAVRRRLLNLKYQVARDFDAALVPESSLLESDVLCGATIQIDRNPFTIANQWANGSDAIGLRARTAKQFLAGVDPENPGADDEAKLTQAVKGWTAIAARNAAIGTNLRRPRASQAVDLIYHGYVSTMMSCNVLLGYRLPPRTVSRQQFDTLVSGVPNA